MVDASTFDIRITSIAYAKGLPKLMYGVPIEDGFKKTATELLVVNVNTSLPLLPVEGQCWTVVGEITERRVIDRGGSYNQTHIYIDPSELKVTMPEPGDNFVEFVAKEKEFVGVGQVYARKLWTRFGKRIYGILEHGDTESLEEVLTPITAETMVQGWKKFHNLRYLHWFSENGVPHYVSSKIMQHHNDTSVKLIRENPYNLQVYGMSFEQADRIALEIFSRAGEVGFTPEDYQSDNRRLIAAVEEALHQYTNEGHTVASHADLLPLVKNILNDSELAKQALKIGYEGNAFLLDSRGDYHPRAAYIMEGAVASHLMQLARNVDDWTEFTDEALAYGLESLQFPLLEKQSEAVVTSLVNSISVISGGAGTGKTTVLRVIFRAYEKLGFQVYPVALAGRAAKRITEGTGYTASTIEGFIRNTVINYGEKAVVVIDEASMVHLQLMYRLLMSVPEEGGRFILVGDAAQLPPIFYGLILQDIIKAKCIAQTELDIVKRQDSSTGIPEFTKAVRTGQVPDVFPQNIRFHEVPAKEVNETIAQLYLGNPSQTQIIAATYRAVNGGIDVLNDLCQKYCNPTGQRLDFLIYGEKSYLNIRVGDPVIFTENDWEVDVQNGTMGHLISVGVDTEFGLVTLDDGRTIELTESLLHTMKLAYAISLHKGQGSQFPRVVIALSNFWKIERSWVYTALTRAEVEIDIVCTREQFEQAVKRPSEAETRKTSLARLMLTMRDHREAI